MWISKENLHWMAYINLWVKWLTRRIRRFCWHEGLLLCHLHYILKLKLPVKNFHFCPQHYHNYQMGFCQFVEYYLHSTGRKSTFVGLSLVLICHRHTCDTAAGQPGTPLWHSSNIHRWIMCPRHWPPACEFELSSTLQASWWLWVMKIIYVNITCRCNVWQNGGWLVTNNHILMEKEVLGNTWQVLSWV